MNSLSRKEKIDLLKAIASGKKPPLPEPDTFVCWQYDGDLFIEQQATLQIPRKGGLLLNKEEFLLHITKHAHLVHMLFDDRCELTISDMGTLKPITPEECGNQPPLLFLWRNLIALRRKYPGEAEGAKSIIPFIL